MNPVLIHGLWLLLPLALPPASNSVPQAEAMGRARQGGGCLAWLFCGEWGRVGHRPLQGPHLLGWGSAKARLACPVARRLRAAVRLGAWLAGFLYDANEGSGRQRGGGAAFVLHLSLLEGPQRETRGPLQTQVALISLPVTHFDGSQCSGGVDRDWGREGKQAWSCAPPCIFQGMS